MVAKNSKPVRFGKFVKKRSERENQYIWSMKQFQKLSGAESRQLKQALEQTAGAFLKNLYEPQEQN